MWTNKDTKKYEYTIMIGKIPLYNILMVSRSSKVIWRSFQGHLVSDLLLQHIAATLFMSLTVKVTTEQKNVTFPPARKCFSHPPGAGFYGKKHFLAGGNVTLGNIFSRTKMFSWARHPMGGWWGKYIHSCVPFEIVIEYGWFRQ